MLENIDSKNKFSKSSLRLMKSNGKRNDIKRNIYQELNKPTSNWSITYNWFSCLLLASNLILFCISTIPDTSVWTQIMIKICDLLVLVVYCIEYIVRIWVAPINPRYRGVKGLMLFIISPLSLINWALIIVTVLMLGKPYLIANYRSHQFDWLRIVHVMKLVCSDVSFKRWRLVWSVICMQQQQLITIVSVCLIWLAGVTFIIYFIESSQPDTDFTSMPKTLWWTVISLLTVGYGDMYPKSDPGKFIAGILLIIAVSLYAVPSGIIGTGIALKVEELRRHRKKHMRRRLPAALLIQWTWRYFVAMRCRPTTNQPETIKFPVTFRALCKRLNATQQSSLTNLANSSITAHLSEDESQEIAMTQKQLILIQIFCLLQFQLARLRFQGSNPSGDINDLIDRHQIVHEDTIKRFQLINNRLMDIERKLENK